MRSLFALIFSLSCVATASAQYNNLDAGTVKKLGLYKIVEWTTNIDSLHNTTDSSCTKLIYSRTGRLAEKDYDFSPDNTQFIAVKYTYNDKGFLIDSAKTIPYSLMTRPVSERISSTVFLYDDHGKVKKMINKWPGGAQEEWNYGYDDQDLLYYIDIKTNIKQGREIRFEYTFLPR
jgi:hypothetical protein